MTSLIIDTSLESNFVMLSQGGVPLKIEKIPSSKDQTKYLLPTIDTLLDKQSLKDLIYIAVGIGPGTFTGTRIGVVTAKTLAFAHDLPLIGFCSLQRYVPKQDGSFIVTYDAKSKGYYAISGVKTGNHIHYTKDPYLLMTQSPTASLQSSFSHLATLVQQKFINNEVETPISLKIIYL